MFKKTKDFLKKIGEKISTSEVTLVILFIIAIILTLLSISLRWFILYKAFKCL